MFKAFKAGYQDPDGARIARIAKQLGWLERIIYRELAVWGASPGGRLGLGRKEKNGLKSLGSFPTNRNVQLF